MITDQRGVDRSARDRVERSVVGLPVDAPELGAADVGEARAELVAQEPEQAEDRVGIGGGCRS